ncbi:MAG: hypothetical protein KF887_12565 [Paracoccaceae bacterium]|nr:MAG: hypothetical protein KF887_12565 [Paracoccaceae bacterium]
MTPDKADPKGLIREAYRIEGIGPGECRSIFVDWALSLAPGADVAPALEVLIGHYGSGAPDHPMTRVLHEGATPALPPKRRGGRAARVSAAPPPLPPER